MVRRTDRPAMTIAVDLGHKTTKQNKHVGICANQKLRSVFDVHSMDSQGSDVS